jgi:3-oxoacyl-[acyl-carrier protein] reductase
MELGLKGKVALVTGASKGIGLAVALELAREGAELLLVARDQQGLDQAAAQITSTTKRSASWLSVDMSEEVAIAETVRFTKNHHGGRIDILINNAGGSNAVPFDRLVEEGPKGYWLNCLMHIALTRALLPGMSERRWGRIVNVGGTSAWEPVDLNTTTMAKAGLYTFAKALSRRVAREGITVNTVAVGRIDTSQLHRKYTDEAWKKETDAIPAGRFGTPEEVSAAVAFLSSEMARYITGTVVTVDGGLAAGL